MIIMELYFFRKLNLSGNNFKMFILKKNDIILVLSNFIFINVYYFSKMILYNCKLILNRL